MASRTLTDTARAGTSILASEASEAVRDLKCTEDGDIGVLGSGMLCRPLLAADLVDEIRLFIHPLLLGTDKRLFGELPRPRTLALKSVAQTNLGTIALVYTLQS